MVEGDDEIREHCLRQGYSKPVIHGGLERLVGQWEAVAASLAAQESQYYYDYLNDMDGRRILAEVLPLAWFACFETLPPISATDGATDGFVGPLADPRRRLGWRI